MELVFKQVAIAEDGNTVLGLTEEGKLYYKLFTVTHEYGWRPVVMTVADEKEGEIERTLRKGRGLLR